MRADADVTQVEDVEATAKRSRLRPLMALAPYVGRYRGRALLALMNNEDELGFVLGHETGHIADGHIARFTAHINDVSTAALIATILGVGGAVAGGGSAAAVCSAKPFCMFIKFM